MANSTVTPKPEFLEINAMQFKSLTRALIRLISGCFSKFNELRQKLVLPTTLSEELEVTPAKASETNLFSDDFAKTITETKKFYYYYIYSCFAVF